MADFPVSQNVRDKDSSLFIVESIDLKKADNYNSNHVVFCEVLHLLNMMAMNKSPIERHALLER